MTEYNITQTSYRTWEVEKDDGTTYFISIKPNRHSDSLNPYEFACSCRWFIETGKPTCRHIRMVKEYINKRIVSN